MRISNSGLALIRLFEGLRLEAYRNFPGEPWTIGYGHTGPDVTAGKRISNDEAEQLLLADVARFEQSVRDNVGVPITQNQFDALVSLAYNIGTGALERSTLLRKLNAGDYQGAANEFLRWNRVGDQVVQGLKNRRERERELFLRGMSETMQPIPAEAVTEPSVAPPARPGSVADTSTPATPAEAAYDDFGQPREAKPMAPAILSAVLPAIISAIPELTKLFPTSEVAGRNVAAATKVLEIVQQATGTVNAQQAAEKIAAEPSAAASARLAVQQQWYTLVEAGGGGIAGARAADAAAMSAGRPFYRSPAWVMACLLLPAVYIILFEVMFQYSGGWTTEVRSAIATSTLSLILGSLVGYYYGAQTSANRPANSAQQR